MENGYDILSHGGKGSSAFLTETELLEIQRTAEEQKLKQAAALIERQRIEAAERFEKEKRDSRVALFEEKFNALAPIVERIIRDKRLGHKAARSVLFFLALTTIVGMPLADIILPPSFEEGKGIAKKLSFDEISQIKEFASVVRELRKLSVFVKIAQAYYKNGAPNDRFLFSTASFRREYGADGIGISDLMSGVLTGLGISTRDPN
jgi:hypothetical protein